MGGMTLASLDNVLTTTFWCFLGLMVLQCRIVGYDPIRWLGNRFSFSICRPCRFCRTYEPLRMVLYLNVSNPSTKSLYKLYLCLISHHKFLSRRVKNQFPAQLLSADLSWGPISQALIVDCEWFHCMDLVK